MRVKYNQSTQQQMNSCNQGEQNLTLLGDISIGGMLLISSLELINNDSSLTLQNTILKANRMIIRMSKVLISDSQITTNYSPCLYGVLETNKILKSKFSRNSTANITSIIMSSPISIFISADNFQLQSSFVGSTIVFIDSNELFTSKDSIINTTASSCKRNKGLGKGLESELRNSYYCTSGASSAGYGTFSVDHCYLIIQYFMFLTHSFPYLGKGFEFSTGSGGYGYGYNTEKSGYGGGIIYIYSNDTIETYNSSFLVAGGSSSGNVYQSAGSGGSISMYCNKLSGDSSIFSAKGGNSYNRNGSGAGGIIKISPGQRNFTHPQTLFVDIGQGYQKGDVFGYGFSNGIFYGVFCEPGFYTEYLYCIRCPPQTYNTIGSFACLPCPQQSSYPLTDSTGNSMISQCFSTQTLPTIEQWLTPGILDWYSIIIYMITLLFFLLVGLILKKKYKKKLSIMQTQQFTLQLNTDNKQDASIITDQLKGQKTIKFEDLMYHVHRITLFGRNTPHSPWILPDTPPQQIKKYILLQGFMDFSYKFNELARWSKFQKLLYSLLKIVYPLYWLYYDKIKKQKYKKLQSLFEQSKEFNLLNNYDFEDKNMVTVKISKNTDYTICYIDFMVYDRMNPKYFNLSIPFIITLSGQGNFLRPFYLEDRDVFFNSLFYIVNCAKQKMDKTQSHNQREALFSNLVGQKKQQENNAQLIRFLKQFNKKAIILDLSSPIKQFIQLLIQLIDFLNEQNNSYFNHLSIQIDLILMITKLRKSRVVSNQIHILKNKQPQIFEEFIRATLPSMAKADEYDLKLGLFVYNPEQEIIKKPQNRQSSLNSVHSGWVTHQIGLSEEQSMRQPFMDNENELQNDNSENLKNGFFLKIKRFFNLSRYYLFTHRKFNTDKDTLQFCLISVILCQALFVFVWSIKIEYPYVFVNLITPFIGIIFIVSGSYGIGKLFLVLNAMTLINQIVSFVIYIPQYLNREKVLLEQLKLIFCQLINITCNLLIIGLGTRFITVCRKLGGSKMFK